QSATTARHLLSLHDALPISCIGCCAKPPSCVRVIAGNPRAQVVERRQVALADGIPVLSGSEIPFECLAQVLGNTLAVLIQRGQRSEEHTSELQSRVDLVCRL